MSPIRVVTTGLLIVFLLPYFLDKLSCIWFALANSFWGFVDFAFFSSSIALYISTTFLHSFNSMAKPEHLFSLPVSSIFSSACFYIILFHPFLTTLSQIKNTTPIFNKILCHQVVKVGHSVGFFLLLYEVLCFSLMQKSCILSSSLNCFPIHFLFHPLLSIVTQLSSTPRLVVLCFVGVLSIEILFWVADFSLPLIDGSGVSTV